MLKTILAVSLIAVSITGFSFAAPPPEMGAGNDMLSEKGFKRALEGLGLTPDQEKKLREIHSEHRREIMNLQGDIRASVLAIQEEFKKEKSDEKKIDSHIDRLAESQKKLMKIRSEQMLKSKSVLTSGQFKKLADKLDKAKMKMRNGFWHRDKPGKTGR